MYDGRKSEVRKITTGQLFFGQISSGSRIVYNFKRLFKKRVASQHLQATCRKYLCRA